MNARGNVSKEALKRSEPGEEKVVVQKDLCCILKQGKMVVGTDCFKTTDCVAPVNKCLSGWRCSLVFNRLHWQTAVFANQTWCI